MPVARTNRSATRRAPAQPGPIDVFLLGVPRLRIDGDEHVLERKDAALLALLAVEGRLPRARAAAMLWPDVDAAAARNSLRQRLHRLNKRAVRELVATADDILTLTAAVTHDLRGANGRSAEPIEDALERAAPELLDTLDYQDCDAFQDWLVQTRIRQRAARLHALAEQASELERDGQIARALRYAQRIADEDPLLEHGHRRLMRLHYLRGDRAAALSAYQKCRDSLERDLGASPGAETVALAKVIESSAAAAFSVIAPLPVTVLRPPTLVGRATAWAALTQAWETRRIAVVSGEAGVGKSRLLGEFAAARGALVLGARPGDAHMRYAVLARLLRALRVRGRPATERWARRELARLVPEFDPAWTPIGDVDPARLSHAVTLLLSAAAPALPPPVAGVAIDDLQFADAESIEVLATLLRDESLTVRWLIGARAHELPAGTRAHLDALATGSLSIALDPLDESATAELLASLQIPDFDAARWSGAVYRHTGGNPVFVLETLAAMLSDSAAGAGTVAPADLPIARSLGQLIEGRLAQLSAPALKLIRLAALANRDFSLQLAADVLGQHPLDIADPWAELERARIVRGDRFAHDLFYETTLRTIPQAVAALMHRTIAIHLARQGAEPERLAAHFFAAQDWSSAMHAFRQAADRALARSRRRDELALLRRAAECLDRESVIEGRHAIELQSARAALVIARADDARSFADAAVRSARSAIERLAALSVLAETLDFLGDADAAMAHVVPCLAESLELRSAPQVLAFAALRGRLLAARGNREAGLAVFEEHAGWLAAGADPSAICAFMIQHAQVLDQLCLRDQAAEVASRALVRAEAAGDRTAACLCRTHLGAFCVRLGRSKDSFAHLQEALALREELGGDGGQVELARIYLGVMMLLRGRYGEALDLIGTARQRLSEAHAAPTAAIATIALGRTYTTLGQFARASQLLGTVPAGLPPSIRALALIGTARLQRALGQPPGPEINEAMTLLDQHRQMDTDLMVQLQRASDAAGAAGAALAMRVALDAEARQFVPILIDAQCIACARLLEAGDAAMAASLARELLLRTGSADPWMLYIGEIFWHAHRALTAAGDRAAALAALNRGLAWIDTTLANVPDPFKDSFLNRNPFNRAILNAASRLRHKQ